MKKKILLVLYFFLIVFAGMILTNIIGCVIYGFSNGDILARIVELPYVLYAVLSLILSTILFCLIFRKSKK